MSLLLAVFRNLSTYTPMIQDPNDNKLMTKRVPAGDRAVIALSYPSSEARALRSLAASFTLKAGKKASLSLVARRSLQLYTKFLSDPTRRDSETLALNSMSTPSPSPATHSKRKTPAV